MGFLDKIKSWFRGSTAGPEAEETVQGEPRASEPGQPESAARPAEAPSKSSAGKAAGKAQEKSSKSSRGKTKKGKSQKRK